MRFVIYIKLGGGEDFYGEGRQVTQFEKNKEFCFYMNQNGDKKSEV